MYVPKLRTCKGVVRRPSVTLHRSASLRRQANGRRLAKSLAKSRSWASSARRGVDVHIFSRMRSPRNPMRCTAARSCRRRAACGRTATRRTKNHCHRKPRAEERPCCCRRLARSSGVQSRSCAASHLSWWPLFQPAAAGGHRARGEASWPRVTAVARRQAGVGSGTPSSTTACRCGGERRRRRGEALLRQPALRGRRRRVDGEAAAAAGGGTALRLRSDDGDGDGAA